MRCKFCFATFQDVKRSILPKGHLSQEQAIAVVKELAGAGFSKITIAGGEPTLCAWLPELIRTAKQAGMTTMIVTNGTKLSDVFLLENKNHLDWIAISIDSLNPDTNLSMGRAIGGRKPLSVTDYMVMVQKVKQYGYGLKINTVVNSQNFMEDMSEFIRFAQPKRWKIMQMLPIIGQNDDGMGDMLISSDNFKQFVEKHENMKKHTIVIPESNEQMQGSYAMVDPAGRFFDNADGFHHYSRPILEAGVKEALKDVRLNFGKFLSRGGIYEWEKKANRASKITISGQVASGKSTVGKLLAERLGYNFISIGNRTRDFASKKGMSIVEFQKACLQNPELDKEIDRMFAYECNNSENIVVDYRLGFLFVPDAVHIFLCISEVDAIERLKKANRQNETHLTVNERNETFKKQFQNSYGVDYTDFRNYDLYLNVKAFTTPEAIVEFILDNLKDNKNPKRTTGFYSKISNLFYRFFRR